MDGVVEKYWQTPPITRIFTTAMLGLSLAVHTNVIPFALVAYYGPAVWKMPPQLWRLLTSYMITAPMLGIFFDTFWVYRSLLQLETGHPKFPKKADLVWYLIFVGAVIQILCATVVSYVMPVFSFLGALIIALSYTATQDQRGQQAGFYFFTIPAQLVPYAMILINLVYPNGIYQMIPQATGLLAAHLHDFLSRLYPQFGGGPNLISTPSALSFVDDMIGEAPPDVGAGRGPLPDAWRTRGTGRRLG